MPFLIQGTMPSVNLNFIKWNIHDITTFFYLHDVTTITFFKINTVNAQTWATVILFIVVRYYFWFFKQVFLGENFRLEFWIFKFCSLNLFSNFEIIPSLNLRRSSSKDWLVTRGLIRFSKYSRTSVISDIFTPLDFHQVIITI